MFVRRRIEVTREGRNFNAVEHNDLHNPPNSTRGTIPRSVRWAVRVAYVSKRKLGRAFFLCEHCDTVLVVRVVMQFHPLSIFTACATSLFPYPLP
jgi:hypothetical protein